MKSSSQLFSVSLIRADVIEADLIEDTYLIKPDNSPDLTVKIAVTRLGSNSEGTQTRGMPIVLLHGLYQNRGVWMSSVEEGFAKLLLNAGFDPWLVDCRAHGDSPYNEQYKSNNLESYAQFDLPAVQQFIFEQTGQTACWIGCAEGGVAVSASLSSGFLNQDQVNSLVLISSQVGKFPLSHRLPISRLLTKLKLWFKTFADDTTFGPEHESVGILKEQVRWSSWFKGWRPQKGLSYWKGLHKCEVPVLGFAGVNEKRHTVKHCRKLHNAFPGHAEFYELSIENGFSENYNHRGILNSKLGPSDIVPIINHWLNSNFQK